jgi:hypothetical protein
MRITQFPFCPAPMRVPRPIDFPVSAFCRGRRRAYRCQAVMQRRAPADSSITRIVVLDRGETAMWEW